MIMSATVSPGIQFQFVGGDLSLDYCNTVGGKRGLVTREHLHTYADFLSWCRQAGLVTDAQLKILSRRAGQRPADADRVLSRGIELRETIYRIFSAVVDDQTPDQADLGQLNAELSRALGRLRVEPVKPPDRFALRWVSEDPQLDHPLGPVARAAAHLLVEPASLSRVRLCQGDSCGWLFLDASKNHSRRWCDMRDCGNRAKVRRHRRKHHAPPKDQ
jgi:predicted RNA-binding Zn ribbon-like protein